MYIYTYIQMLVNRFLWTKEKKFKKLYVKMKKILDLKATLSFIFGEIKEDRR